MDRTLAAFASGLLAAAVMLGAFGAHGLKDILDAYSIAIYEKAVFYHFVHALGALVVAMLPAVGGIPARSARTIGVVLLVGVLIFSGSLYLIAVTGVTRLGMITPFGGTAFIAAWCMLTYQLAVTPKLPSKMT